MSEHSIAPESTPALDPIRIEIALVELEMAGFSPKQAARLVFLGWLNALRNIEHVGVEG